MLKGLADAGYAAYAIDLLGSGYSSKPSPTDDFHLGHNHLFVGENENERQALEDLKARIQSQRNRIDPPIDLPDLHYAIYITGIHRCSSHCIGLKKRLLKTPSLVE